MQVKVIVIVGNTNILCYAEVHTTACIDDTPSVLARYQDCNANCHENQE